MISRRLLRIKALITLYAYSRKDSGNLKAAEEELLLSIKKSYDLYHLLLLLLIDIFNIAEEKIELARQKKIPSEEDLNPNTKLIENRLFRQLEQNVSLKKYCKSAHLSWHQHDSVPRHYYSLLISSDIYRKYMNSGNNSYSEDKKLISALFNIILSESEYLESALEEMSIYWNDDLDFISIMVEKTFRRFKENSDVYLSLMDLYRSDEDEVFVRTLLRKTILKKEFLTDLIDRNTTNWEIERVALMDTLVMQLAICEVIEFTEIPVKVSLNEYIEIAKFYCTSKSSNFVNGILDKIVKEMREQGVFQKRGRGLVGEPGFEETKQ